MRPRSSLPGWLVRALAAVAALAAAAGGEATSAGPPLDHVRIPWPAEAAADCTSCHSGRVNGFPGSLALQMLPAAWAPGQTYALLVDLVDPDSSRAIWGFEAAVVGGDLAEAGRLDAVDLRAERQVDAGRGIGFVRQTAGGNGQAGWSIAWEAPRSCAGDVTFYLCANAGNRDFTPFSDHIFCATATVPEAACDPPLAAITGLAGARQGTDIAWRWDFAAAATLGYRLYTVPAAGAAAGANACLPAVLRDCPAPTAADTSCVEVDGAAATPDAFYQVIGVCTGGIEGPN